MGARISAIIPAFNEEATIAVVVRTVHTHPRVGQVIVVDDGSTDATAACARAAGALVLATGKNGGKAHAMEYGVRHARGRYLLFVDADLVGLTHDMLTRIIEPVVTGKHEMYVGIHARSASRLNRMLPFMPVIGGERALSRRLWEHVPARFKKRFQIEIALNYFAKRHHARMGQCLLYGVRRVIKERKHGVLRGMVRRILMIADICIAAVRLYIIHAAAARIGARFHAATRAVAE